LRSQPQKLIDFIVDFYSLILKARPNPAHLTLSALEKEGILDCIITQNVDNLHQAAGSRNIIELHGNAFRIKCTGCPKAITLERDRLREMIKLLGTSVKSRIKLLRILSRYFPRCQCGSRYRIDIVLFGEMLPEDGLASAYKYLDSCRVLLLIGTSLVVYPAASLPLYAKKRGAALIEINSQKNAFSDLCNYSIIGQASQIMPEILQTLGS
jgi:NAD-dependent deacetylase